MITKLNHDNTKIRSSLTESNGKQIEDKKIINRTNKKNIKNTNTIIIILTTK